MSSGPFTSLNLAAHVGDDPASVATNRDRLRRWAGAGDLVVLSAVHGADVVTVDEAMIVAARRGSDPVADAVVSRHPGVAVAALGADCLTLAIVGDDDRTTAAVHCGWRGLAADVVGATLSALEADHVGPAQVVLGPSICGSCYPVPPQRVDDLATTAPDGVAEASVVTCPDGQPGIDVAAGVRARLLAWGVPESAVTSVGGCTAEEPDLFSYRRDGRTGRQGMVVLRPGRMGP